MEKETKISDFTDLIVWQKAHKFVMSVYKFSSNFPNRELYGLTSQFRRAAISIPANIAEGFGKPRLPDKLRFLDYSQGSVQECRYYLILAEDLGYGDGKDLIDNAVEIGKLISSCSNSIKIKSRSL